MKFTLSWLKEHLDTTASLAEICEAVTAIGLELESVDDRGATPWAVGAATRRSGRRRAAVAAATPLPEAIWPMSRAGITGLARRSEENDAADLAGRPGIAGRVRRRRR